MFFEKKFEELNNTFEKNLEELADLLKEVHDKIVSGDINSKEDLITVYEKRINEMTRRFPDTNHERVKSYFNRYDFILNNFEEYKKKRGDVN